MTLPLVNHQSHAIFPPDFRFGVADSDLQVIGEEHTLSEEGSQPTMWLDFARKRGLETPLRGIDRYHRWREDVEQMRRLGARHYRTSVSMARTIHEDGSVNERAIEWYRRYFEALKEADIAIYATLHHWELPQRLHEAGGWPNRDTVQALVRHTEVVVERLGDLVDEYFLINEPWCSSMLSYYEGIHAPGNQYDSSRENLRAALAAAHHLLLAQGLAVNAISERAPGARMAAVLNFQPAYAPTSSHQDRLAAHYRDGYYNVWFLDSTFRGAYPEWMVELYGEEILPEGYEADMETIRVGDRLHALGINYYRGGLYRASGGELQSEEVLYRGGPQNSLDWPVFRPPYYAEGMYDILQQVWFGYRAHGLKRIYVTENGMALRAPEEVVEDGPRIEYLRENISLVYKALLHGIPVESYFTWTLMDNYEWAEGYRPESAFGLIHVDMETMERTPKKSASWYSALIKTRDVAEADAALHEGSGFGG